MSRPNDIPQDVWDGVCALPIVSENFDDADLSVIARAILAAKAEERQNAAKRYRDGAGPDTWDFFGEAENAILSDR